MIDILLIQPRMGIIWNIDKLELTLPLGLLSVSRLIYEKYTIKIFDQRIFLDWKAELKKILDNNNLICIGITSMLGEQLLNGIIISIFIKNINPGLPIIWGGVQPTLTPNILLKRKYIDIVVKGEGEATLSELVDCIKNKNDLNDINGILFKKNGKIIENEERKLLDLNKLSPIPYNLIDIERYIPKNRSEKGFYIETSRGCPNKCIFCYNGPFNRGYWRAYKANRVIEEIKILKKNYRIDNFSIVDDTFFVDLKRAKEIVSKLNEVNLNIQWELQGVELNSLIKLDDNFVSEMEKSGLIRMQIGIESASIKMLKFMKKDLNLTQVVDTNRRLNKFNIFINYHLVCGFPHESNDDLRISIAFLLKLLKENRNARLPLYFGCTPYPKTELYKECYGENTLDVNKISAWIKNGVDKLDVLYLDKKRNKFLNKLIFISFFIDNKYKEFNISRFKPIFSLIWRIYKPIATFRLKYLKFNFLVEKRIFDTINTSFLRYVNAQKVSNHLQL